MSAETEYRTIEYISEAKDRSRLSEHGDTMCARVSAHISELVAGFTID